MSLNHQELKEAIEYICVEKGLDINEVKKSIEIAIAGAYRKEFGQKDAAYQVEFDTNTGKYTVYNVMFVVEEVTNPAQQVSFIDARLTNPDAHFGEVIKTPLDIDKDINFGRIASQIAKQVLTNSIQNARHGKILQQFKEKVGDIVTVEVDYFHKGGYYVKLGQTHAYLNRDNILPIDKFKSGTYIKALIASITEDAQGNAKVLLTRTTNDFIVALIKSEIPEVASGLVNIDKVVREPGSRTKILVSGAEDADIDPVGAILGRRNMRIMNILREINVGLQEKLDIIENQPEDLDLMIMDALEPAQIEKVEIDLPNKRALVYCYKEDAALAVGRRGINIKLAQELLDLDLELVVYQEDIINQEIIDADNEDSSSSTPSIILD
jgi:transcription termination/antitermination protein NusA